MKKILFIFCLFIGLYGQGQIIQIRVPKKVQVNNIPAPPFVCGDADANAYIANAGITDETYKEALCVFFTGLKDSVALWDSMSTGAAYWLIGGTEDKVKLNIFNPVNSDAAGRLTFTGSPTFTSSGIDWNGTSQYANTHLAPSDIMGVSSGHISYYSMEDIATTSEYPIGSYNGSHNVASYLIIRDNTNKGYFLHPGVTSTYITPTITNSLGFFMGSRTTSSRADYYKNGISIGNNTGTPGSTLSTLPFFIGALNLNGSPALYTNKKDGFNSVGRALTTAQARALNFLVEQLMDGMGVGVQ